MVWPGGLGLGLGGLLPSKVSGSKPPRCYLFLSWVSPYGGFAPSLIGTPLVDGWIGPRGSRPWARYQVIKKKKTIANKKELRLNKRFHEQLISELNMKSITGFEELPSRHCLFLIEYGCWELEVWTVFQGKTVVLKVFSCCILHMRKLRSGNVICIVRRVRNWCALPMHDSK